MGWLSSLGKIGGAIAGTALGSPMLGAAIGGGVGGAFDGNRDRQRVREQNLAQSEITKYAPWTGMTGKMQMNDNTTMGGLLDGAASGIESGKAIGDLYNEMDLGSLIGGSEVPAGDYNMGVDTKLSTGFDKPDAGSWASMKTPTSSFMPQQVAQPSLMSQQLQTGFGQPQLNSWASLQNPYRR